MHQNRSNNNSTDDFQYKFEHLTCLHRSEIKIFDCTFLQLFNIIFICMFNISYGKLSANIFYSFDYYHCFNNKIYTDIYTRIFIYTYIFVINIFSGASVFIRLNEYVYFYSSIFARRTDTRRTFPHWHGEEYE